MGGRARNHLISAIAFALGWVVAGCGRVDVFPTSSELGVGAGASTGNSGGSGPGAASAGGAGTSGVVAGTGSGTGGTVTPPVSTLAGNGTPSTSDQSSFADGTGGPMGQAEFNGPEGVAVDASGNVYVGDSLNHRIREIDPSGNVTTLAGNGVHGDQDGSGGPTGTAEFNFPSGLAVDRHGNVYVADANNNRIRKIDPAGNVTTLAPHGEALFVPSGVAVDGADDLFVTDTGHNRVIEIDPSGTVTTVAGNGQLGDADGTGGSKGTAEFASPTGLAVDAAGSLYIADFLNSRIRKIDPAGNVTTIAGNGTQGYADGTGGPHGTAQFDGPVGIAVDQGGNLYVGDAENNRVRMIDPLGNVTTLAGNGIQGFADGTLGPLGSAEFHNPAGVAVDLIGNVYVADSQNNRIRKITP
jgi:sugar lactone lactonase YvrE